MTHRSIHRCLQIAQEGIEPSFPPYQSSVLPLNDRAVRTDVSVSSTDETIRTPFTRVGSSLLSQEHVGIGCLNTRGIGNYTGTQHHLMVDLCPYQQPAQDSNLE